jgi:hypothetical protein
MGSDTVVWADDNFYRLAEPPRILKPLTPIFIRTHYLEGKTIGKFASPSFEALFEGLWHESNPHPSPFIKGTFTRKGTDKVVFTFNPNNLLSNPARATFYSHTYAFVFDTEILAQFSARPPKFASDVVYPFVKLIKTQIGVPAVFLEPQTNILPLEVVQDLAENPMFNFLAAVGIPTNNFLHPNFPGIPRVYRRGACYLEEIYFHACRQV